MFFFRIEFTSLFRCSRFPCWFARHLQRWCIFQELLVTLGGLGIVGMYTFESSASRLVLLWLVLSHFPRPVCFSCTAFAGSCLVKDGVRLGDRDGFWLGFCFLPSLLSAGCSFLPPDVVRASSLWHVLRILTLFLALTGTMALHVLKLDGVTSVYGIFFSVAVFSVLVLGRFSDLSLCCLRQSPVWVPRLFY